MVQKEEKLAWSRCANRENEKERIDVPQSVRAAIKKYHRLGGL